MVGGMDIPHILVLYVANEGPCDTNSRDSSVSVICAVCIFTVDENAT